ncbi:hypothetical protein [Streptomyces sp. NPDC048277]|uniref:hypothetical protein n=1 Tax=Streptomyces sp. NPDC048277 TaxID=3155027 RepID=UPI0033E7080D
MLALRLTRVARPAVQLRRLLVATAAAGTGFLLLAALGYAMSHPEYPTGALLRLTWCAIPLAATVYLAVAVARTDPGARPRPGLSALGLGPARLMAVAALHTALACTLGSLLALLVFLHLRGDLTGVPFGGAASDFLAADQSLPLPAALTLLAVPPVLASTAAALTLRPRDLPNPANRTRGYGRFGAYVRTAKRETFGTYGRFGARRPANDAQPPRQPADGGRPPRQPAGSRAAGAARVGAAGTLSAPVSDTPAPAPADGAQQTPAQAPDLPAASPAGLPWGIAVLAAGLAVESYASVTETAPRATLPGGLAMGPVGVLAGWALTALGLVLAAPGLTHLCGRLLQTARPGVLRLLAGRILMAEATRIGRPLGVVCAVASAAFATTTLHDHDAGAPGFGPLTALGGLVVAGCTVATLLTAAVEARQSRADTTEALLRMGARATMLRSAAALRAGALLALFVPLTLLIADLAALPLAH